MKGDNRSEDKKLLVQHAETPAIANNRMETIPPNSAAVLNLNETISTNSSNKSFQRENEQEASGERLDEFFDSYVSSSKSRGRADSNCSDSVSRIGEGDSKNFKNARIDSYLPSLHNHQIPESWFVQLQSESSSLATLIAEKKISDSRRTFCLFVTFDLILSTLLWLIMCGTSATSKFSFFDIVGKEIQDYTVNTSMFDVVVLAFVRFCFLVFMYAVLRIRHWWPVAVSTSTTDILLILKVFPIFENSDTETYLSKAIPITVVILLTNFILSWIEVWFIDFKVLPAEAKLAHKTVRHFLQQSQNPGYAQNASAISERAPLLGGLHSRGLNPPHSYYTGATSDQASYYSMPESDFESVCRSSQHRNIFPHQLTREEHDHVEKSKGALNQLWALFKNDGMWNIEKELDNGDKLFTADVPGHGKTFRIDTIIRGVTAQHIFEEIILKAENMPTWNTAVSDVKILRRIGEQTAISLEVSKPAARGIIQSRDFVTVRRVDKIENMYVSAGISTEFSIPDTGRVRGVNGPTGFIVEPLNDELNSCKFTWILNTNLKGSLPQYLVNSNLSSTMINFVKSMKEYLGAE